MTDTEITEKVIQQVVSLRNRISHLEKLEIPISSGAPPPPTSHASLTNLTYGAAGHTGFQPTVSWPLVEIGRAHV